MGVPLSAIWLSAPEARGPQCQRNPGTLDAKRRRANRDRSKEIARRINMRFIDFIFSDNLPAVLTNFTRAIIAKTTVKAIKGVEIGTSREQRKVLNEPES
jgi:hypothetical protein